MPPRRPKRAKAAKASPATERRVRPPPAPTVAPVVVLEDEEPARAVRRPVTRSLVGSVAHMRESLAELGADEEG